MKKIQIIKLIAQMMLLAVLLFAFTACGEEPQVPETTPPTTTEPTVIEQSNLLPESHPGYATQQAELAIAAFAQENEIPLEAYPGYLLSMLAKNPETREFVLEFPLEYGKVQEVDMSEYANCTEVPLFMQWDQRWGYTRYGAGVAGMTACGPVSLSMAAWYVTDGDPAMSPDQMIQFALDEGYCVAGNGTAWSMMSDGVEKLGLKSLELQLSLAQIQEQVEQDHPVVCIMGPGDFTTSGHFIVIVGVENGLLRVNDCNSKANSEKLWDFDQIKDQIRNLWAISKG